MGEGDESAAVAMADPTSQFKQKQHFIYMCEIDRVFAITNYLVIIKKN